MIVKYLGRGYHGVYPISSGICNVKVKQANTISWKVNEYYLYMSTCQHCDNSQKQVNWKFM